MARDHRMKERIVILPLSVVMNSERKTKWAMSVVGNPPTSKNGSEIDVDLLALSSATFS